MALRGDEVKTGVILVSNRVQNFCFVVSLFRLFRLFRAKQRNSETAILVFQAKQRNSETVVAEKNETTKQFRCFALIVFIFKNSEKMVLEHIFRANLLILCRCSRKIENFGNKINSVLERIQTLSTDIVKTCSY